VGGEDLYVWPEYIPLDFASPANNLKTPVSLDYLTGKTQGELSKQIMIVYFDSFCKNVS